jgi:hypothetical protein
MPRARRNQKFHKRPSQDKTPGPLHVDGADDGSLLKKAVRPPTRTTRAKSIEKPRTAPKISDSRPKAEEIHFVKLLIGNPVRKGERASNYGLNRSSQEGTVQQSARRQAGRVRSASKVQIVENDIQLDLLRWYRLESRNKCNSRPNFHTTW